MKRPSDFVYLGLLIILAIAVAVLIWPRSAAAQEIIPLVPSEVNQPVQPAKPPRPMGRGEQLLLEAETRRKAQTAEARATRAEKMAKAKQKLEARKQATQTP